MQVSNPFPAIFNGCILLLSSLARIFQAFSSTFETKIPRFWSHPNEFGWWNTYCPLFSKHFWLVKSIRFLPLSPRKNTPFPIARFWWASWPLSWIQRPCSSWDCARWHESVLVIYRVTELDDGNILTGKSDNSYEALSDDLPNLVMTNSLLLNMAIEIVDFPIKHGDFPCLSLKS